MQVAKYKSRLEQYHLLPSKSPYASALVVASKATKPFVRMCGDYRWVNQYILIQHEWIPNVLDSLQKLSGFQYYIDVDLCNAFHQIRLSPQTSDILSILTPCGLMRPKFLPEGVSPASARLFPGHTIPRHFIDFYISTCGHWQKASANVRNNVTQPIIRHIIPATIRSAVGIDMVSMEKADESGNMYAHIIVNMFF
jgi:hypothetical protein